MPKVEDSDSSFALRLGKAKKVFAIGIWKIEEIAKSGVYCYFNSAFLRNWRSKKIYL